MKFKTAYKVAKRVFPRRGCGKKLGSTAKKAVAIIAGIAVAAGIAAGAVFMHNEAQQKQMAEQVTVMEYQREAGANTEAYRLVSDGGEQEKKRSNPLAAALTAIGGALGAGLAAFLGRLIGGAVSNGVASAAIGSVLPALFVLFTLFLALYRIVYRDKPLKSFFTARNMLTLGGASLVLGIGSALADKFIQNEIAAALTQSVFMLFVIAVAWYVAFLGGRKAIFEPRMLLMLLLALCAGGLFGGVQILLANGGYTAGAARAALYAGWLVAVALCFGAYVFLRHKKNQSPALNAA